MSGIIELLAPILRVLIFGYRFSRIGVCRKVSMGQASYPQPEPALSLTPVRATVYPHPSSSSGGNHPNAAFADGHRREFRIIAVGNILRAV
jgi:prepilin-type processing-associated H-X9-DG protein